VKTISIPFVKFANESDCTPGCGEIRVEALRLSSAEKNAGKDGGATEASEHRQECLCHTE
jgi:hypothetical protein